MHMSHTFSLCVENLTRLAELHPIPEKGEVWHTIVADLIGPLSETLRKNKYYDTDSNLERNVEGFFFNSIDAITCTY